MICSHVFCGCRLVSWLFVCFCAKLVVHSCYLILCGGPIELCSIVVIHLGDFDIGLYHPLTVQCIYVCIMKVFMMERERGDSDAGHQGTVAAEHDWDWGG